MPKRNDSVDEIVLTRLLQLNATVYGIVLGTVVGLGLFVITNWLVIKGGPVVGPHLVLLSQVFIGYRVTFIGSLIGLVYGVVLGFGVGYFIAWMYNRIAEWRNPKQVQGV